MTPTLPALLDYFRLSPDPYCWLHFANWVADRTELGVPVSREQLELDWLRLRILQDTTSITTAVC